MIEERKKLSSTAVINRSRSRAHNRSLLSAANRFASVYCLDKQQQPLFTITYVDDNTRLYRDVHAVSCAALGVRMVTFFVIHLVAIRDKMMTCLE